MTEQPDVPASYPFQQVDQIDDEEKIKLLEDEIALLSSTLYELQSSKAWKLISFYRRIHSKVHSFFHALRYVRYTWSYPGRFGSLITKTIGVLRRDGWQGLRKSIQQYEQKQEKHQSIYVNASLTSTVADRRSPAILFISHEATRTGAPVFLLDLIRFLADHLDMRIIILLRAGGELEPEFKKLGLVVRLDNPNKLDVSVLNVLRSNNVKLVYSNTITNGIIQNQLRSLNCPILCHVHELSFSIETAFGEDNFDFVRRATTLFLAGSQAVADGLIHRWGITPEMVVVAYPFINTQNNANVAREEAPIRDISPSTIIIGACGTLMWRKGPDIFLQAAQRVIQKIDQPVFFVWVGGTHIPDDLAKLQYDAELMGIEKNIIFTGRVSSHIPYLMQFDIFLLPSREDPFPLVVLDAATLGKPVICFDKAGGAPEFVENNAGIITPYMDVENMSDAIVTLIKDADLRKKMGEQAREKAENYDISTGGMKILNLIKKALTASL